MEKKNTFNGDEMKKLKERARAIDAIKDKKERDAAKHTFLMEADPEYRAFVSLSDKILGKEATSKAETSTVSKKRQAEFHAHFFMNDEEYRNIIESMKKEGEYKSKYIAGVDANRLVEKEKWAINHINMVNTDPEYKALVTSAMTRIIEQETKEYDEQNFLIQ